MNTVCEKYTDGLGFGGTFLKLREKENHTKWFLLSIKAEYGVLAAVREGELHTDLCILEIPVLINIPIKSQHLGPIEFPSAVLLFLRTKGS